MCVLRGPADQGFITLLGAPSPVQADVKEGESLSLRAEFDAYPEPSDLSWSYDGKRLLNTTEHVITVHRRKYRWGPLHGRGLGRGGGGLRGPARSRFEHSTVVFIRYISELRLVRVLSTEGGIYTFSTNHDDASVSHVFHVYVSSE